MSLKKSLALGFKKHTHHKGTKSTKKREKKLCVLCAFVVKPFQGIHSKGPQSACLALKRQRTI